MRASRTVAAILAALVAAVLSLGGASLVIAGQPDGKGGGNAPANSNQGGNGNGRWSSDGTGQSTPAATPAPAATPGPSSQASPTGKSHARSHPVPPQQSHSAAPKHNPAQPSHAPQQSGPPAWAGVPGQGATPAHQPAAPPAWSHAGGNSSEPAAGGNGEPKNAGGDRGDNCNADMTAGTDNGKGNNGQNAGCGHTPITICHATGSATNPYVEITIDTNGLNGHGKHPDDIIPAPAGGCPQPSTTPPGGGHGQQGGGQTPPPCENAGLSTALTHSAALALKLLSAVNPEFAALSNVAAEHADKDCGSTPPGGGVAGEHSGDNCNADMTAGTDNGKGNNGQNAGCGHTPITICHATGSATNPYVEITIDTNGLNGHENHPDDIIPAPAGGCPQPSTTPPGGGTTPPGENTTPPGEVITPGNITVPPTGTVLGTTEQGTTPATETPAPAGQQQVLGERAAGTTKPATAPSKPQNEVLGANAQGTNAPATAPAAARRTLPAANAGGSLPFTGTDAILVLFLGCLMILGGVTLYRVAARRA